MRSGNVRNAHGPLPQLLPSEIVPARQNRAVAAGSYYARRSAVDPAWRIQQIAAAKERERRRFEDDPDGVRARRRANERGWYQRLRETDPERFQELRAEKTERDRKRRASLTDEERAAVRAADVERKRRRRSTPTRSPFGESQSRDLRGGLTFEELAARIPDFGREQRSALAYVLADEVRSGRVELHGDVYSLNGGLPADVKRALLDLDLVDDRR